MKTSKGTSRRSQIKLTWSKFITFCTGKTELSFTLHSRDTFDDSSQSSETLDGSEAALEHQVSFSPPLYRQRYLKVAELLADDRWKDAMVRIIDFGCKLTKPY